MLNFTYKFLFITSFFLLSSCNFIATDVTDFNFILPEKSFTVDSSQFGIDITGDTIPEVACPENTCSDISSVFECGNGGLCLADVDYALKSDLISLKDEVEEFAVVSSKDHVTAKFKYIQMEVTTNTLNFDLPPMDIYIAPQSVTDLFDASGNLMENVSLVGSLSSIDAGKTGIYDINLTQSGEGILTDYVSHPEVPFYLFVSGTILFEANSPIPTGSLEINIHSMATASIN